MSELIDPALFRETLGHYPTGVAVVTAVLEDGQPAGMVVGTFSSVSLDPPLIAFFPAAGSSSFARLRTASTFCVNVLASDQEPLCRQMAIGGTSKFDGVKWRAAPLGSPILDGAVSWIECTYEDVREAGDHFIALGRVQGLAVERSTLPLLFFQGGYGRFSPGSFIAGPDPDLIEAAQLAESFRVEVENLAAECSVNCSVLVRVRQDAVQVLAANHAPVPESHPLGQRQPIIPPLGAVFMVDSPPSEIDEWLHRAPNGGENRQDIYRGVLDQVRERGYSLMVAEPELIERHQAVLSEFESSDRLPRHERAVRQVTAEMIDIFCPDLVPGARYDLASIVVPVPSSEHRPALALRMSGLPTAQPTEQVELWIGKLKQLAGSAAVALAGRPR